MTTKFKLRRDTRRPLKKTHSPLRLRQSQRLNAVGELYQLTMSGRQFEIEQLMQRNNFFMVFQGVLLAGFLQAQTKAPPIVTLAVCIVGICCSYYQRTMATGAKFWQARWEYAASAAERELLDLISRENHVSYQLLLSGTKFSEMVVKEDLILTAAERADKEFSIGRSKRPPFLDVSELKRHDMEDVENKALFEKVTQSKSVNSEDAKDVLSFQTDAFRRQFASDNMSLLRCEDLEILKRRSVSRIPIKLGLVFLVGWSLITTQVLYCSFAEPQLPANWLGQNAVHRMHLAFAGADASPTTVIVQLQNSDSLPGATRQSVTPPVLHQSEINQGH
ncbi:RipA family octameric membrane protein [Paraburkholderia bannensis]|uniref:RipA family octameric membrane protein n=1 Tax=Paraburkholderia bannensis TaxID=765414 RepID=UPI0012EBF110|nr:hypothetical protein [Paraburkholderia bannensis]